MSIFKNLFGGPQKNPEPTPDSAPASGSAAAQSGKPEISAHWEKAISETLSLDKPTAEIDCAGIDWNAEGQQEFVSAVLPQWRNEVFTAFDGAGIDPGNPPDEAPLFLDLAVLYTMIAARQPTRLIEIGCGYSTKMIRQAFRKHNLPGELIAIDPEPTIDVTEFTDAFLQDYIQTMPLGDFQMLQANEVLHLDLTHQLIPGGDVEHVYQRILPCLKKGVVVGIQGIPLPHPYTAEEQAKGFGEQAYLQLFLQKNSGVKVLWAGGWAKTALAEDLRAYCEADSVESRSVWFEVL
ncbi:MAG: class I SAM-dependent methyltransferase [Sumerlaeia bacterium]